MLKKRLIELALSVVFLSLLWGGHHLALAAAADQVKAAPVAQSSPAANAGDNFDFFSDKPVQSTQVVELPPPKSRWLTVAAPLALVAFFFLLLSAFWWLVPFKQHTVDVNLHTLPTGVKRGIAMATVLFGIAFCFGASEIWYQLQLNGSAEAFFAQMSLGKLIIMTHAHLFGFTTAFFIIGIPFSLQFNHLRLYQWVFPIGLAASVTDVMSWWGIKYVSPTFENVSFFCGILFSFSYMYMLVGLLRVLLFPEVIWVTDKDRLERLNKRQGTQK